MSHPEPTCDPAAVAELVKSGSDEALLRIADCYLDYLLAVGRCACRDPSRAPDAVHDALISAAERLTQFRGDGSVKSWLAKMVVNACRCGERGRKNDPAWNQSMPREPAQHAPDDPEQAAARGELAHQLSQALARLDAADRQVFLLAELGAATAPELARSMGISAAAVRSRLVRIRRRLRGELAPVWRQWQDR
jgi:RNA polymerase sigma-70 factor, ECF subfamily